MERSAYSERHAPEGVVPPEAEHADDRKVRREAVHSGPHEHPPPVLPPGRRRQPGPREQRPHRPRGAVVLPVRLGQLGRQRLLLGHADIRPRRRDHGGRRGGGVVGVAVDVEAVGYAETIEAGERERSAEDEQVEEEDDQPEDVAAASPGPRSRQGPRGRRRRGARVPAVVRRGRCGRRHRGDRRSARRLRQDAQGGIGWSRRG